MASTTLHLVRHGNAQHNGPDPELTELGRRQAEATVGQLAEVDFSDCFHSPKRRAAQTAAIISDGLGTPIVSSTWADDLTPIPENWSDVPERHHGVLQATPPAAQDPGGRRLDRALAQFNRIGDTDRDILIITHNFVIGWFVRSVLEAPWWRWIGLNSDEGALTILRFDADLGPRLVAFNRVASP